MGKQPVPMPKPKPKNPVPQPKKKTVPKTQHVTISESKPETQPPLIPPTPPDPPLAAKQQSMPKPEGPKHRKLGSRNNMLAGITAFKASSLKHVDADELQKKAEENPSGVSGLLASTLKNYRQFVMDDDDSD